MINRRKIASKIIARWRMEHCPIKVKLISGIDKQAATIEEIISGIDPAIEQRSKDVTIRLIGKPYPFEWEYMATSGKDKYIVSVRAQVDPDKPNKRLVKGMEVLVSCSCPYWQWQGPEHHAQKGKYLYGIPRGTASTPNIKDPTGINYLCKHTLKVLKMIRTHSIA